MRAEFDQAIELTEQVVDGLEPELLLGPDATTLTSRFAHLEHLAAAGKALCARRAVAAGEHERAGHRNPGSWLGDLAGEPVGKAASAIETAKSLADMPALDDAFRSGELSSDKAAEVALAAGADSSKEQELVDLARKGSLRALRERADQVRAAAAAKQDGEAAYEAIRSSRRCRTWTGRDGAVCVEARLTPDDGAVVVDAITTERDRIFKQARRAGLRERPEAYAADGLVDLVRRGSRAPARGERDEEADAGAAEAGAGAEERPPRRDAASDDGPPRAAAPAPRYRSSGTVHLRVDLAALRRGHLEDGELCEIPGVGHVPVSVARRVLGDHLLKVIVTDGVDIRTVCHLGRAVPAHLRTALEERDPVCVVPFCNVASGLEIDHRLVPFADGGPASLENLARLCKVHHYLKTHRGFRLEGGPGAWEWIPPQANAPPG
jgi:hypothetical protein